MVALPSRRHMEIVSPITGVGSEFVVFPALFLVLQDAVGFADLLELDVTLFFLADIRVVLSSKLSIGALDLSSVCLWLDSHDFVIVNKFHSSLP